MSKTSTLAAPYFDAPDPQDAVLGGVRWRIPLAIALSALIVTAIALTEGGKTAMLVGLGGLLGLALYHGAYGFAHGFRVLFAEGRSAHVRAQLLMLAAAVLLFFPALAAGSVFGQPVRGFVFPAGVEVAIGAFLFGIGMQIAGGCATGTLYTVGGGSLRMLVTLVFTVAGATLAGFTGDIWSGLPALPGYSTIANWGLAPALAANLAVFALAYLLVSRLEQRRHGAVVSITRLAADKGGRPALLTGPWPYAWAALALAVLNFATLIVVGRPWGVTQAYVLWGSQALEAAGLADPSFWAFWEEPTRAETLHKLIWRDTTSIMTLAVMAGAMLAAVLAGRFAFSWRMSAGALAGSVIGGVLLGFGAIIATGCNISAFFSGVASGSLHGWLWILAALPGNWIGVKLRPLFGLDR